MSEDRRIIRPENIRIVCRNDIFRGVKHNQGKQALKRIRAKLGIDICREPLLDWLRIKTKSGIVSGRIINANPKSWERLVICIEGDNIE
jgi:hypothetical protein